MAKNQSNEAFNAGKEIEVMKRFISSSLQVPSFGYKYFNMASKNIFNIFSAMFLTVSPDII
jgi:hypothetical protein